MTLPSDKDRCEAAHIGSDAFWDDVNFLHLAETTGEPELEQESIAQQIANKYAGGEIQDVRKYLLEHGSRP